MFCYTITLHLHKKKIYQQTFLPLPVLEEMEESEYVAIKLLVTHYPAFGYLSPKGMATCSTAAHGSGSFGDNSVASEEKWEAKVFGSSERNGKKNWRPKVRTCAEKILDRSKKG